MKQAPEIVIPKSISLPPVETVTLPNGLPVHSIRTGGQDVVRISLVWEAGSAVQTIAGDKPFTASSTLNMLAEGSDNLSAHQIAERLDFVGSYYDVSIDRDYALATFCCLDKFIAPTLEVMSEILLHPAFPPEEVALYARKRMERLALERSKPATKAREMFSQALFGEDHPYGVSSPEGDYMNLDRDDLRAFHERFYGAGNCFAVCSLGDDPAQREAVLELLGQLPVRSAADNGEGVPDDGLCGVGGRCGDNGGSAFRYPTPHSTARRTLAIDGAVQSAVRVGRLLFPRRHPDFVGMQVVATILGGYFGSRLVQNLREKRGYTYGVMAAMVNLRHDGYLAVVTEVAAEATADTVEQIFAEMERLKVEAVSIDELENVQRSMLGEVMRILDGPFGIVDVVIENIQVGSGDSGSNYGSGSGGGDAGSDNSAGGNYLDDFISQVESITPERIMALARKYLDRDAFSVVIVGRE